METAANGTYDGWQRLVSMPLAEARFLRSLSLAHLRTRAPIRAKRVRSTQEPLRARFGFRIGTGISLTKLGPQFRENGCPIHGGLFASLICLKPLLCNLRPCRLDFLGRLIVEACQQSVSTLTSRQAQGLFLKKVHCFQAS